MKLDEFIWDYLEAAPSDQSTGIQWYNGTSTTTEATGTAIGTGSANTATIVNIQGVGSYAAQLCDDLTIGGSYSDWFLPSKDELNLMYINLHVEGVGDFVDDPYWSSLEFDETNAWRQRFFDGNPNAIPKFGDYWVRAVRAF